MQFLDFKLPTMTCIADSFLIINTHPEEWTKPVTQLCLTEMFLLYNSFRLEQLNIHSLVEKVRTNIPEFCIVCFLSSLTGLAVIFPVVLDVSGTLLM